MYMHCTHGGAEPAARAQRAAHEASTPYHYGNSSSAGASCTCCGNLGAATTQAARAALPHMQHMVRTPLQAQLPSQVVLAQTISRGKNLRSIISKVLIQMCAKLGGIPWAVDNLPFMDKPTMICRLDVFHATNLGKKSVLALSASMNNSATTYWSTSVVQDDVGQEASNSLCTGMASACEAFKRANGAFPA